MPSHGIGTVVDAAGVVLDVVVVDVVVVDDEVVDEVVVVDSMTGVVVAVDVDASTAPELVGIGADVVADGMVSAMIGSSSAPLHAVSNATRPQPARRRLMGTCTS